MLLIFRKTVIGRLGENAAQTDLQHSRIPRGQGGRRSRREDQKKEVIRCRRKIWEEKAMISFFSWIRALSFQNIWTNSLWTLSYIFPFERHHVVYCLPIFSPTPSFISIYALKVIASQNDVFLQWFLKRIIYARRHCLWSPHDTALSKRSLSHSHEVIAVIKKFKHKDSSNLFRSFHTVVLQHWEFILWVKCDLNWFGLSWKNNCRHFQDLRARTISILEGTSFRNISSSKHTSIWN